LLEIHKVFKKGKGSERIFAIAMHPSVANGKNLLEKKNAQLKDIAEKIGAEVPDRRSNVSLRRSIWEKLPDLIQKKMEVALSKEDGKQIWDQIQKHLPHFALFRSDRPNTDDEAEIQDPMRFAVQQALDEVSAEINEIKTKVKEKTLEVAIDTLKVLENFDKNLANELQPHFKAEPKWDSIFKLSLTGDDQIPINKRGSGVRRLILISFFKAEADRYRRKHQKNDIIYAIEEPETSQHPDNQKAIIESLIDLSEQDGCQIILTTHVPALTELIPIESLRYISSRDNQPELLKHSDELYNKISSDLGVLPDSRVKLIVCVEGPNDICFLKNISKKMIEEGHILPDLTNDPRIVVLPLGGETLRDWVNNNYLKNLGKPEVHIYDRDETTPPKYQETCDAVNQRDDDSVAFITTKREMENYFHKGAIKDSFGIDVEVNDEDDVPKKVGDKLGVNTRTAKRKLNRYASAFMNYKRLKERDPSDEVLGWFREINLRL